MNSLSSIETVHDLFFPINLREGDPIAAAIHYKSETYKVDLWALSPMGAEFVWPHESLKIGEKLDITIYLNKRHIEFKGISICNFEEKQGRKIFGVRWLAESNRKNVEQERPKRWIASDYYAPTVVCSNPILFDDMLLFRVVNISADGALLHTSMRNKVIIPGIILDGVWSFPMTGSASGEFKVQWTKTVSVSGVQKLAIGVKFSKRFRDLNMLSGEYVLQFGDAESIAEIRKSSLSLKNVKNAIIVDFAKTEEDYQAVIALRRVAYQHYSKDEIPEMTDKFDTQSRILTARHHGKIVGTLRMIFQKNGDTLEIGEYLKLPDDFPENHELVEVSRLAVDPDYQLSSIVLDLQRQCYLIMLQTKRRFLVGAAPEHLCEAYKRMGVKVNKEIYYSPKSCPDLKLYLIVMDLYDVLANPENVGPVMWNKMYDKLLDYAETHEIIEMNALKKMNVGFYRMLKVFS